MCVPETLPFAVDSGWLAGSTCLIILHARTCHRIGARDCGRTAGAGSVCACRSQRADWRIGRRDVRRHCDPHCAASAGESGGATESHHVDTRSDGHMGRCLGSGSWLRHRRRRQSSLLPASGGPPRRSRALRIGGAIRCLAWCSEWGRQRVSNVTDTRVAPDDSVGAWKYPTGQPGSCDGAHHSRRRCGRYTGRCAQSRGAVPPVVDERDNLTEV